MKIALVTIYSVPNYGSVLQAYASQKVLEELGHECVIIKYDYYQEQSKNRPRYIFKNILLDYLPFLKTSKLKRFRDKYLNFSRTFKTIESLSVYDWKTYDAFVVGSDQVWNTKFLNGNSAFLLSFVPDNKPRYSLSSSFALKELPQKYISLYRKELSKFSVLSVRESNGVKIINQDLNIQKDVKVVLDPTLLLDRNQWLALVRKQHSFKPYILVYLWTYAFDSRPYFERVVEFFQKKTGFYVRVLEGHRFLKNLKVSFIDNNRSSIPEFINLFANANLVITSSFHGTAFALNFGKPLISVVPDDSGDDRQSSLLRLVGADSSIIKIGADLETINPNYDVEKVTATLDDYRKNNIKWIKDALQ